MSNFTHYSAKTLLMEIFATLAFIMAVYSFDPTLRVNDIVVIELFCGFALFAGAGLLRRNNALFTSDLFAICTILAGFIKIAVDTPSSGLALAGPRRGGNGVARIV